MATEFRGTPEEAEALQRALAANCTCSYNTLGQCTQRCAAHRAFIEDQRFVDGLLMGRNLCERLLLEEFKP